MRNIVIRIFSATIKILIISVLILFPDSGESQTYLVHQYTVNEGISSSFVYDVTQDTLGRMWFATRSGISVYDGFNWTSHNHCLNSSLNSFAQIEADRQGNIWTCHENFSEGIAYYDGEQWLQIKNPAGLNGQYIRITALKVISDSSGQSLFVGTLSDGLYFWNQNEWTRFNASNSVIGDSIFDIETANRVCYILTEKGITQYQDGAFQSNINKMIPIRANNILTITPEVDRNNESVSRLWVAGRQKLGYLANGQFTIISQSVPEQRYNYKHQFLAAPDYHGGLIYGNINTLYHFDAARDEISYIGRPNGLITEGSTNIFIDREYNIWIASLRGVSKIPGLRFKIYRQENGLLYDEVTAVTERKRGEFIFGHEGGISILHKNNVRTIKVSPDKKHSPTDARILDLIKDDKNNIWATVSGIGLLKITPENRLKWYHSDRLGKAQAVLQDKSQRIWLSTNTGLYYLDGKNFVKLHEKFQPKSFVRKMFNGTDSTVYFATSGHGVYSLKDNKWRHYYSGSDINRNKVYALLPNYKGMTLVGSINGLHFIRGDSLVKFNAGFSIENPVYFIIRDNDQRLWFGTDAGVFRWDEKAFKNFNVVHGLAGMETNRSAGYVDHQGRIWIGTDRGVSVYDERCCKHNEIRPEIKLTTLNVEDKKFDLEHKIKLDHSQNTLTFNFLCISFVNENEISFEYKLEGFDKDWVRSPKMFRPTIRFIHLSPGAYRFHIRAKDLRGNWSSVASSPEIVINSPFWQSWWFYLVLTSILALLIYLAVSLMARRKYSRRLEKQVEQRTRELKQSEEKYRTLFQESRDAIFTSTPEGRFLEINPAAVRLFGYDSAEELLAVDIPQALYFDINERHAFQEKMSTDGFVTNFEMRLRRKDGKPIKALLSSTAVYDEQGSVIAYRGFLKDITENLELKERLAHAQRMESVGLLAGGIAHDFNNILGGILGYASLLKLKINEDDPHYKYIDTIEESAVRGADLTNQLLVFARKKEGKRAHIDLNRIVEETVKIIRSTFPKTIEIEKSLSNNTVTVLGDETQLHQIVMNLCVNARDAINEKGIISFKTGRVKLDKISAQKYVDAVPGEYVVLDVGDTGVGMDSAVQKKIFEPFFSTKEQGKGTGLGLSMVYGFVRSHEGFIDVKSALGKGTLFRIFLPANASAETVKKNKIKVPENGSELILVVDDEEIMRSFLKQALENHGYKVLLAKNGLEGLEIFRQNKDKIKLIILDMLMPKMSGSEALIKIRETDQDIKVIIASGYSDEDKLKAIKNMDIAGFIQKPFKLKDLLSQIRTILDS